MKSKYNKFWDYVIETFLAFVYYGMIACLIYIIVVGCTKLNNYETTTKTETSAVLNEPHYRARVRTYK